MDVSSIYIANYYLMILYWLAVFDRNKSKIASREFPHESIVKNVLLKEKSFLPRRGASQQKRIQFSLTHIIQSASPTLWENPATEGVIIIVPWPPARKRLRRVLFTATKGLIVVTVTTDRPPLCHIAFSFVTKPVEKRGFYGQLFLPAAIPWLESTVVVKQWRCHKRDAEGRTRADIAATCSHVVILEMGNSILLPLVSSL